MKTCGGVQSPVHFNRALRLCQECSRYSYGDPVLEEHAKRHGDVWQCLSKVSSDPADAGNSARVGTETDAGLFLK